MQEGILNFFLSAKNIGFITEEAECALLVL